MCEVSEHLQPFYLKHGICELSDHEYDLSMPTFVNSWLLHYKLIVKIHCMTWYAGTCSINGHGLTI
jgi:hypothetical protein